MRDFEYTVRSIPGLARYFKLDDAGFAAMADSGPLPNHGTTNNSGVTDATNYRMPGYLLDQFRKTTSYGFLAGHGVSTRNLFTLTNNGALDNPNNASWTWVLAGLKPHDMSVARDWLQLADNVGGDQGMRVTINTDGSLLCSVAPGVTASSAAGVITRFQAHILIGSYDNAAGKLTVYAGDWMGNFAAVIPATTLTHITTYPAGANNLLGGGQGVGVHSRADGFLDDFALYIGHAVTAAEAQQLFAAAGYSTGLSYAPTKAHRNAPFNRAYPPSQPLEANTVAASAQMQTYSSTPPQPNGAGSINIGSFSSAIYVVSKAFRTNPANLQKVGDNTGSGFPHYEAAPLMALEDVPMPFSGRPSLGFRSAAGSDGHTAIWCPETDEYWDLSMDNSAGTDLAPNWTSWAGGKLTQFSLQQPPAFPGTKYGTTATGIPCVLGVPTIAELVAAQPQNGGTPIPHGLAVVAANASSNDFVYPAARHDGSAGNGFSVKEGQIYRLKNDAATSALIAAMPHPTGRALAQAMQTYGMVVVDNNGNFGNELMTEDNYQFKTVNGYDPYARDAAGSTSLGLLNGQAFSINTMANFPWGNLELLDHTKVNPSDASQPIQSAPNGLTGQHTPAAITMAWPDNPNAASWNVYQKVGASYVKIASTFWPAYTVWNPASSMTLAITAVNGGGESSRSLDFTPPLPTRSRRRARTLVG